MHSMTLLRPIVGAAVSVRTKRAMETPMENRIIETPTELDDRDLDLVSGGWSGGGDTLINGSGNGNTGGGGLLTVALLNGNLNGLNLLSSLSA